jgi:hypothetical protein
VSSSSSEETDRRVEDKLNELCFITNTTCILCSLALGDDAVGDDSQDIYDEFTSKLSHSANDLVAELDVMNVALVSQDMLLRHAARERREFRSKYESTLRELESARASIVVSDETECDE